MAGILGVVDLQQISQTLGLTNVRIPSQSEIDKIKREKFGGPPLDVSKTPSVAEVQQAIKDARSKASGLTSLFYRKDGYSVGDLTLDLILDEDHAFTSKVSAHPVEIGSDITDHIQKQLQAGKLKGLVTNHSINTPGVTRSNARTPGSLGAGRAGAAWEICRWIWERGEPVTIVTCLDTYRDVAVSDMRTRRDPNTGDCLEIEFTFQQMRRVMLKTKKAELVVRPKSMEKSIDRQVSPTQAQGQVVGKTVTTSPTAAVVPGVVK